NEYGFLLSAGAYTAVAYPGTATTVLTGVNDLGQIVGNSYNPDIGFSYDVQTQIFTTIKYPNSNQTFPTAINNAGKIVGGVNYRKNENFGFELVGSRYKQITPPGATNDYLTGVTAAGEIVGLVANGTGPSNFVFAWCPRFAPHGRQPPS